MTPLRALLAILLLFPCLLARAQGPDPAEPAARVAAALEAIWVHGVTPEIAQQQVGREGLPFLLNALQDPACERRDNVVAFLSHLGEAEQVPSLLALLDEPPGPMLRPEDRRALLLVPTALGWMASRGIPEANDALIALTERGPGAAGLGRAAASVSDPERFRGLLLGQAVFGLGLASERQPLAARRLRELAEDMNSPSLRDSAAGTLKLFAGESEPLPRPLSFGSGPRGFPGMPADRTLPSPTIADPESDVHEHDWTYANHPDVTEPMDNARLDVVIERVNLLFGRSDFEADPGNHGEDVACCVSFARSGGPEVFGSTGDGLDVIDDDAELTAILNDPAARVKVVEAINWCGGPGSNIIGCAWQPGNGMAVVRWSNLMVEAGLWAHEYGHNVGLGHNSGSTRFIMYPSMNFTNDGLDGDGGPDQLTDECAAFHSPSLATGATITTRSDACSDVDADDVQDDLDNCPTVANFDQADSNGDGTGDACDCSGQDADGDGVDDCEDNCPDDPNAGQADSDGDSTGDACDGCPNDPNKTAPGACGCGAAETDSDGDGTPDCNDGCPNDPNKTAPGTCGCGVSDADSDGDGTPNCNDGCPNDPNKTVPGACGCGVSDADSDGDGTPNCNDGCPNDPNKTAPGLCGCGVSDADSDGDGTPDCNDGCPSDPNKTAPGLCGCGVSDADSDGDGTPDCNDGCPSDPNKTDPGACGCNKSEADSDGDGTPNCNDDCPSDPGKTAPGDCGCGVPDDNQDGDSHADCVDNCPSVSNENQLDRDADGVGDACESCDLDPNKTQPGACGCGSPDTDSDGDGTPDCNDDCPADGAKTDPGQCGCGSPDTDSDGDGSADCLDACPSDPAKTDPGQCGCGSPDADSDGDGTADCNDGCPSDPNKTAPGACGCGLSDADSDSDGTPDCDDLCPGWNDAEDEDGDGVPDGCDDCDDDGDADGDGVSNCDDACPNDAGKIAPGACGCGVSDVDGDGDGVSDCNDGCPADAAKTTPGACGCGVSDADSDGDGTPDCQDACPGDPAKTAPGDCGCGVSDLDSDGDGSPDCEDACPSDANKTAPGDCGCGIADADSDGDGTPDCQDACPDDADKTAPGSCGCGVADLDSDGDGLADCNDGCPSDAEKSEPGECGCGVPDVDSDGDGGVDCQDACPDDPDKDAPGVCGCGVSDEDSDGDGVADCLDACPSDPGKTGPGACGCGVSDADSDADGVPDCVDNCPAQSNPDQADGDGDGLGDACSCHDRGDVHPDGLGDGRLDMGDFVVGHRKLKGELALNAHDASCGDVAPGTVTCQPADGPRSWCVSGDGSFDEDDLAVIRSQVGGLLVQGCAGCAAGPFEGSLRLPADVAPRGATDERVDVADVIVLLRWAVGFDLPLQPEELLRGDIAPAVGDPGLRVVEGDGAVDVGDVVLALRSAVALDSLHWPLRRLSVSVGSAGQHLAVAVRSSGWPSWASAEGFELADCDESTGGLEGSGGLRGLVCVLDAGPAETPGEIAALTYRAPEAVAPGSLNVEVELVDETLSVSMPQVSLDQE